MFAATANSNSNTISKLLTISAQQIFRIFKHNKRNNTIRTSGNKEISMKSERSAKY
jgi:hypothetical protein